MASVDDIVQSIADAVCTVQAVSERMVSLAEENARLRAENLKLKGQVRELRVAAAPLARFGVKPDALRDDPVYVAGYHPTGLVVGDVLNARNALINSGGIPPVARR